MNVWKVLAIILGVILVGLGIWCMMTPVRTYLALAWVLGLDMILDGVASIFSWSQLRKMDMGNAWLMASGIISIILGIIITVNLGAQLMVDLFIVIVVAIWLIATGVMRVVAGIRLRSIHKKGGVENIGSRWYLAVILGVLLCLLGILSLFDPVVLMFGIGISMGCCIVFAGLSTIGTVTS